MSIMSMPGVEKRFENGSLGPPCVVAHSAGRPGECPEPGSAWCCVLLEKIYGSITSCYGSLVH